MSAGLCRARHPAQRSDEVSSYPRSSKAWVCNNHSPRSPPPEEPQEARGMKYGPIEAILATPAMKEELQQKGRIEVLCSEGFQTLRAGKAQTPFWMDGIYVRAIACNERATVVLLEEECVSVPSAGSDVGTKSVPQQ